MLGRMADLYIQSFPGRWEEVLDYDDHVDEDDRDDLWEAVALGDWPEVTAILRELRAMDGAWRARKAILLRSPAANARGFTDRLWVRVTRPEGVEAVEELTLPAP